MFFLPLLNVCHLFLLQVDEHHLLPCLTCCQVTWLQYQVQLAPVNNILYFNICSTKGFQFTILSRMILNVVSIDVNLFTLSVCLGLYTKWETNLDNKRSATWTLVIQLRTLVKVVSTVTSYITMTPSALRK